MKKIVMTLLEAGILEEDIHRILDILEDAEESARRYKEAPSVANLHQAYADSLKDGDKELQNRSATPEELANRDKTVKGYIKSKNLVDTAAQLDRNLQTKTGTPNKVNADIVAKANAAAAVNRKNAELDSAFRKIYRNR